MSGFSPLSNDQFFIQLLKILVEHSLTAAVFGMEEALAAGCALCRVNGRCTLP